MGAGVSAWGLSWGLAWGAAWGAVTTQAPVYKGFCSVDHEFTAASVNGIYYPPTVDWSSAKYEITGGGSYAVSFAFGPWHIDENFTSATIDPDFGRFLIDDGSSTSVESAYFSPAVDPTVSKPLVANGYTKWQVNSAHCA